MSIDNNNILSTALRLGAAKDITPECVILGFVKLISMNETSIRAMLTESDMAELEKVRKFFDEQNMDFALLKMGLRSVNDCLNCSESEKKSYKEFEQWIQSNSDGVSNVDILEKAFKTTVVPMDQLFEKGNAIADVIEYVNKLKKIEKESEKASSDSEEKNFTTAKDDKEKANKAENDSESKRSSIKKDEKINEKQDFYSLAEKCRTLSGALFDVVKGQDPAVVKFIKGYNQAEISKSFDNSKKPRGNFFFFGPPGVGKTLLAETVAENLGIPHKTFYMSQYAAEQSYEHLVGFSKTYKDAQEGELTGFVMKNPECFLIFDEMEKANLSVMRLFLHILGSGEIESVYSNKMVSFRDVTIIFTSNVGKALYQDKSVQLSALPEVVLLDAIRNERDRSGNPALPPELCSRIASGNAIVFDHMKVRCLLDMINSSFEKVATGMFDSFNCHISYSKNVPLLFLYHQGNDMDARVASSQSGNFIKNEVIDLITQIDRDGAKKLTSMHFDVDLEGTNSEDIKKLFVNTEKSEVLVLGDACIKNALDAVSDQVTVYTAKTMQEAMRYLDRDISAILIDPSFGKTEEDAKVLSITDYGTEGVQFFHYLISEQFGIPIYVLNCGASMSEMDINSCVREGAVCAIPFKEGKEESFSREIVQLVKELYMENANIEFSQKGYVIDFNTKQVVADDGSVTIIFYDLKKKLSIDMESRNSALSGGERPKEKLDDVIGAENAKKELRYFMNYLKNPKKYIALGGKTPKGVLLYGPPGTGKTMLARAMAGECDFTFFQVSAADLQGPYVGQSEENIRTLFAQARKYAPSIIFIDEIDAIGKQRTGSTNTANTEKMLNSLLTQMDGFATNNKKRPVFVLAATNYGVGDGEGIGSLDGALMRRFDNKICVDLPNEEEREKYTHVQLKKKRIKDISDEACKSLAQRSVGMSLAQLELVIDLAFRNAIREERTVTDSDLATALDEFQYGELRELGPDYMKSTAIHEMGHSYVYHLSGQTPPYITIQSRGNFGGYMALENSEKKGKRSKDEFIWLIRTALAGRACEQIFYGGDGAINTGASGDLKQATNHALSMLCTYGMDNEQMTVLPISELLASPMAQKYVDQVNEILKREMEITLKLIEEHKDVIKPLADELYKNSHLTGEEFEELLKKYEQAK